MTNYAYISTSLAGADPRKNGLFEISLAIEKDGKLVSAINCSFRPHGEVDWKFVSDVNPRNYMSSEDITSIPRTEQEAMKKIRDALCMHIDRYDPNDRYFLVCYSQIPMDFLKAFFDRMEEKYFSYFWSNPIDVMALCSELLKENRSSLPNMRLQTAAGALGAAGVVKSFDFGSKVPKGCSLWDTLALVRIYEKIRFENLGDTIAALAK